MKSDTHHKNITLGESLVPPMFTLALFMGAILAWMLFSAIQKRPITFGLGGFRSVLASAAPVFWVGAAPGAGALPRGDRYRPAPRALGRHLRVHASRGGDGLKPSYR